MRLGQNPMKSIDYAAPAAPVTVAVLNYIPVMAGYYKESLDVLKTCLNSIWDNTDSDYDLMVFDNGSCVEVRDFLHQARSEGKIQYLIFSEKNVGIPAAWNFMFSSAPGQYVAYSDSDVYFAPGWLPALLEAYEIFPNLGMLTGMPLLNPQKYSSSTLEWAETTPEAAVEQGQLLSWEDYWRHAGTLTDDEQRARQFYAENNAVRLTCQGRAYYVGAGHFQYLSPRHVLQQCLPLPTEKPMGNERLLDETINRLGYLRLCTPRWYVEHIGNSLQGWQPRHGSDTEKPNQQRKSIQPGAWWARGPVRSLLEKAQHHIFEILYRK